MRNRYFLPVKRQIYPGLKPGAAEAPAVPTWSYITLERSNPDRFYTTTSLGDFVGGTSMTVAYTFRVATLPSVDGTNYVIDGRGGSAGWAIYADAGTNTIRGFIYNSGPTIVEAPHYNVISGDVGKTLQYVMTYDGTTVRSYINGAQIGVGTPTTGYATPASQGLTIGAQGGATLPSEWHQPVALAADLSVATAGQIATLWTDTQAALDVPDLPTGGTKFLASDWAGGAAAWASDGTTSLTVANSPAGPTPYTPSYITTHRIMEVSSLAVGYTYTSAPFLTGSTSFGFGALIQIQGTSSVDVIACHQNGYNAAYGGWCLFKNGVNIYLWTVDGSGTQKVSPYYNCTSLAGDGLFHTVYVCHDGSHLRVYIDGVEQGTATAITGHTAGTQNFGIGYMPGIAAWGAEDIEFVGVSGNNGDAMGSSAVATWHSAVVSAADIVAVDTGSGTAYTWKVGPNTGAGWKDTSGTYSLTRSGVPTYSYKEIVFT